MNNIMHTQFIKENTTVNFNIPGVKKPTAKVVVKKPYDEVKALEAIEESFQRVQDAWAALSPTEKVFDKYVAVMRDISTAKASIEKYGVVSANMSILDEGGKLSEAIGLESLAIEALDSLSESTQKALKANYLHGLEALESETSKNWVEVAKKFLAQIVNWCKEHFTMTARVVSALKNAEFKDELDPDKTVSAMKADDLQKLLGELETTATSIKEGKLDATITIPDRTNAKISKLGWTLDLVQKAQTKIIALGTKRELIDAWNEKQREAKEAASSPSEENKDKAESAMTGMRSLGKVTSEYGKGLKLAAMTVLAVGRAAKKAEPTTEPTTTPATPTEPAK